MSKRTQITPSRACKRIEANADSAFQQAMSALRDIRAGKLTEGDAKTASNTLGHAVKALNSDVQNRHAEQNHVKQAMQLAATDRDLITGYKGLQADLVVAAMETLENRDTTPMHRLARVA